MKMCLWVVLTILCALVCAQKSELKEEGPISHSDWLFTNGKNREGKAPESFVAQGEHAMVVTEGEEPTRIGVEILRQGGNAIDAAIAVSFALSVYRPQSTGLGGGGFALIYFKKENCFAAVDMRECAPLKATSDMYSGKEESKSSTIGAFSVATPGLVAGLYEMHEKYGSRKLTWAQLVEPSVKLARDGFPVYPHLAGCIEWLVEKQIFDSYPSTKKHLSREDGKPLAIGDRYTNIELANTLEIIARKGKDGFYQGDIAREIVSSVKEAGGILTQEDLDSYLVKYRIPVRGSYRGYEIYSMPPPSSGGVHIVQMLNVFENYDVNALGCDSARTVHLKAEVMRRAFADRSEYLGDPDFFPVPIAGLTSKKYARHLSEGISMERASPSDKVTPGSPEAFEKTSTTHFSIIDRHGNAVSSTQTVNYYFGSAMLAGKTGFFLNNEMDDFSIKPGVPNLFGMVGGEANRIEPLKRPLSSMSPTIVLKDGKVMLILGSPGGSRIITAVLNVIVNALDHKMPLRDAVFAPRVHHQWRPDQISLERGGFGETLKKRLGAMGHVVEEVQSIGNVSAVMVDPVTGKITGIADPRREGKPTGY